MGCIITLEFSCSDSRDEVKGLLEDILESTLEDYMSLNDVCVQEIIVEET